MNDRIGRHLITGAFVLGSSIGVGLVGGCDEHGRTPGDVTGPLVTVVPDHATLETGESIDFDVTITGTDNDAVIWRILADPAPGTIDQDGVYTAPDTVPEPAVVIIEAEAQAAIDQPGRAEVTIVESGGG